MVAYADWKSVHVCKCSRKSLQSVRSKISVTVSAKKCVKKCLKKCLKKCGKNVLKCVKKWVHNYQCESVYQCQGECKNSKVILSINSAKV